MRKREIGSVSGENILVNSIQRELCDRWWELSVNVIVCDIIVAKLCENKTICMHVLAYLQPV